MKRIFTFLFATLLVGQAWAYDFKSGNLCYNITRYPGKAILVLQPLIFQKV